MKVYQKLFVL